NDIAGGAGDLGDRMRRGFGGFTGSQQGSPKDTDAPSDGPEGTGGPKTPDDGPPRDGALSRDAGGAGRPGPDALGRAPT
ncbi:hypothetical protein KQH22_31355, partial [Streptomyces sp. Vc714c-19]|nr:hypothetical protein [Streptomyces sp. Vc714c-19]